MTELQFLSFLITFFVAAFGLLAYKLGFAHGKRAIVRWATQAKAAKDEGVDLSLNASIKRGNAKYGGKIFHFGSETIIGYKYYGINIAGFQVGYWQNAMPED